MSSGGIAGTTLSPSVTGLGQNAGFQAQFGLLLQILLQMLKALQDNSQSSLYTVYPFTGTGSLTISTAFPGVTAGTFSIRKVAPATTIVNLPTSGGPYVVRDGNGGAAANNITVDPPVGFTINGTSSYVISTNWTGATFVLDGSNYLAEA